MKRRLRTFARKIIQPFRRSVLANKIALEKMKGTSKIETDASFRKERKLAEEKIKRREKAVHKAMKKNKKR